ncbi:MAG: fasciclin domain-containing protein [Bacteroidota bacterium]|nr:fasciclin domain-containing protein [Bacteroidota bacterium]
MMQALSLLDSIESLKNRVKVDLYFSYFNRMKKSLFLLLFLFTGVCINTIKAQDSLFFYKSGKIIYRTTVYSVDSLTYFSPKDYSTSRSNLVFENIRSNPQLSLFARMIQIAGYENKLDSVTVWAPMDNALSEINLSDTALVKRVVNNHIAKTKIWSTYPYSAMMVNMLNSKRYVFATSPGYSMGGYTISTPNIFVASSVVHVLNGYLPYTKNIWEYIMQEPGHDLLKAYINSHNKTVTNSSTGVTTTTNDLADLLSFTNNESLTYSVLVPSDEAWTDAYNKLLPYCASPDNQGDAAKLAIIHNNFFKGRINTASDSIYTSTSGYKLNTPKTMLDGTQATNVSNGNIINVSHLKMYDPEYWNKTIKVEAQSVAYLDSLRSNYSSTITNYLDGNSTPYVTYVPTTISSIAVLYARFPIPNTLSTKYNIYCNFVPSTVNDTTDKRPYKVKFYLTYIDANGTLVKNAGFDINRQLTTTSSQIASFTTNGVAPTRMLVAQNFEFPYSNIVCGFPASGTSASNPLGKVNVFLKVQNAASSTVADRLTYNRTIRIDSIILEPVQ